MPGPATTPFLPAISRRRALSPAVIAVAVVLLAVHFVIAVGSKLEASTTTDELVHLTAGLSYWQNHDYRLHPENGNLPQRWAALPAWLAGAAFPALPDNEYWRVSDAWVLGHQFFYESGEDHFPRLMAGRAMIALFSVATGLLIFGWSARFFGAAGAFVSLAFFTFSPDFLAHGALVTSDACMVFFFLAVSATWWWHLHDTRAGIWWLSAITLGLAFVAKHSAVLLIPMMVVMAVVRARAPEPLRLGGRTFHTPAVRLAAAAVSALGHGLVVAFVIWGFYGFRFTAFNPGLPPADHFILPREAFVNADGLTGRLIAAATAAQLLPEAFLYGLSFVIEFTGGRSAFLNGEYSLTGWRTFFPWTFLLKTTVPMLLVTVLLVVGAARRVARPGWGRAAYAATPLLTLFAVYWLCSITSALNIGHRHLLPVYPVLFIGAGVLGRWLVSRRIVAIAAVAGLLGWQAAAAGRIAPYFLAYFNPVAGGPQNGWRHLVDSSLDWGQDLPGLKAWLKQHAEGQPVFLSYFGSGQPAYYQIEARRLPFVNNFKFPPAFVKLEPGLYCISATMLQQVYGPGRGPWTDEQEREYQALLRFEPAFAANQYGPTGSSRAKPEFSTAQWQSMIERHDNLRLARLCHYLRVRPPDAQVGYSILIYRLRAEEIESATAGPASAWKALIEQAGPHS